MIGGVSSGRIAQWSRPTPSADPDGDGLVDLPNFADFTRCTTGPAGAVLGENCCVFDFDFDSTIDPFDSAGLQASFTGP